MTAVPRRYPQWTTDPDGQPVRVTPPGAKATRDQLAAQHQRITMLTAAEVAGILRVSRMTVYRMCEREEIPSVRVGRSYRIPERGLQRWMDAES